MRSVLESQHLKLAASLASLVFGIMISTTIVHGGFTAKRLDLQSQARALEAGLVKKAHLFREKVCLTNIVMHEAGGESVGVRKLVGKVVLAMANDRFFTKARTVCDLARVGAMFSNIKYINEVRKSVDGWSAVFDEMSPVIGGDSLLPAGWGCVRGFRVSDDKMETLKDKALKQLGFTVNASGLKYFAKALVPVDTRGSITFYSARGGCKLPAPTTQAGV